ncbi:hypothetical protein pb186bvf_015318 [Paramecium bursaria]
MIKQWGVEVFLNNQQLSAGRCLLQLVGSPVSFTYQQNESKFIFNNDHNKIDLLHSPTCPCFDRDLKPSHQDQFRLIRVACIGIVRDNNDFFLLTKRHHKLKAFPNAWVFPGGMVESQQDLQNECIREVAEETGIDMKKYLLDIKLQLLYESIYPTKIDDNSYPQKQTLCLVYEVKLNSNKDDINIKVQETEVEEYKWIDKITLLKLSQQIYLTQYEELVGLYPNHLGSGIGEGHLISFQKIYS